MDHPNPRIAGILRPLTGCHILSSGWWKFLPHREWVIDREISLPEETSLNEAITIEGYATDDDTLQLGFNAGRTAHGTNGSTAENALSLFKVRNGFSSQN